VSIPPTPSNLPIVDSSGRATPAFLQQLAKLITNASDAMPAPAPVSIKADYTGAFLSTSLPATIALERTNNGLDVTAQSQWAMEVLSGTITATISQGIITITALGSSQAVLQVKSERNHVALYCNVVVNKVLGSAPSGGGGSSSSSATCTTFNGISSTTPTVITTAPLQVTVGASGSVSLSAPLDVSTAAASPTGTFPVSGKWQWYNGTSWVDVAAAVSSSPSADVTKTLDFQTKVYSYFEDDGALTVNATQTGLTPGTTAQFQLLAANGSGTRGMAFAGTATAVSQ
jgi:hypothetical protein